MNILFVNNSEINPLHSGIQRITAVLARGFSARGMNCYGAWFETGCAPDGNRDLFSARIRLDFTPEAVRRLGLFIREHGIDRIIVQECFPLKKLGIVRRAAVSRPGCRLFYCFHSMPGKEFVPPPLAVGFYRLLHAPEKFVSLKKTAVALLPAPVYRFLVRRRIVRDYTFISRHADCVVLLSESYVPVFRQFVRGGNARFAAIGNGLSFSGQPDGECGKRKEVLVVGRLSERAKRISRALRIWKIIEESGRYGAWRLKIVGSGPDEGFYRRLARKLHLRQVCFEGKQDPLPYYSRASILLMTSSYEGFGMVLTEAQQMGVVPVAFDSYSALHDIIRHGRNGLVVRNGDLRDFCRQLAGLMDSPEERARLALNARRDCLLFSEDRIMDKWAAVLADCE